MEGVESTVQSHVDESSRTYLAAMEIVALACVLVVAPSEKIRLTILENPASTELLVLETGYVDAGGLPQKKHSETGLFIEYLEFVLPATKRLLALLWHHLCGKGEQETTPNMSSLPPYSTYRTDSKVRGAAIFKHEQRKFVVGCSCFCWHSLGVFALEIEEKIQVFSAEGALERGLTEGAFVGAPWCGIGTFSRGFPRKEVSS